MIRCYSRALEAIVAELVTPTIVGIVTSASWQCPVCNQPGHLHEPKCFVLELARAAEAVSTDAEERVAQLRAKSLDVRLQDASTVGALLDEAVAALQAAWGELERAETHHRWHHDREGREVEDDDERLRVLMVVAEALDSLGADEDETS